MKKRLHPAPAAPQAQARTGQNSIALVALSLLLVAALVAAAHTRNAIYRTHVTLWDNVTKMSPNKRRAHENYGQALSTAGSLSGNAAEARKLYHEALRQFETVLALKDDGSVPMRDLYREIGVVQFRLERYDDAIATWETGLRHAPSDPSLLNNLSIVLMQKGRFQEAAHHAVTALAGDPGMPQALNTLGQAYMAQRKYDKAAEYFLKAIDREPDVPARYWNAALAFERAKNYEPALRYANRYLAMERDPVGRQRAASLIDYLQRAMKP
jgi:tetratricopeptide (TPR) repeat protein